MNQECSSRKPHAVMDLPSRQWKARKIERLLGLEAGSQPIRLLEIGVGSGGIAHYFATHPSGRYTVEGVDVVDNRTAADSFHFTKVAGVELPFESESFDVVLTNHVIEHVGDADAQRAHLAEARRVLKRNGIGYLAVPNRWMLVEPHYRLAFLSWLPTSWRSPYLRMSGKGEEYDCRPLESGQVEALLREFQLSYENVCVAAMRATLEIERPGSRGDRMLRSLPDALLTPFRSLIPTLIYTFSRSDK